MNANVLCERRVLSYTYSTLIDFWFLFNCCLFLPHSLSFFNEFCSPCSQFFCLFFCCFVFGDTPKILFGLGLFRV